MDDSVATGEAASLGGSSAAADGPPAHRLDTSFRERKAQEALRRAGAHRRRRRMFVAVAGAAVLLAAGLALWSWHRRIPPDADLVASDVAASADDIPPASAFDAPAIVALQGDPLLIHLGARAARKLRSVEAPAALVAEGVGLPVAILSDTMLSDGDELMATLPSTPQDFAFFQAQRRPSSDASKSPMSADGSGTSVAVVLPETERAKTVEDVVLRLREAKPLADLLSANGAAADEAGPAAAAAKALFSIDRLDAGSILALRFSMQGPQAAQRHLAAMSAYAPQAYLGTVARTDDAAYAIGADPFAGENLQRRLDAPNPAPTRRYRLIDAIYSTAARGNVPSAVIGEAIMLLSRTQDLDAPAEVGERLMLAFAATPRDPAGGGRVLFASVTGGARAIQCYVLREAPADAFECQSDRRQVRAPSVAGAMTVPVDGVLTSTFGRRRHPILGLDRLHEGVDWAAPVGTPVVAAFAGTIVFVGDEVDFGHVMTIDHGGGRSTRYAHLNGFAPGLRVGLHVAAGQAIGAVGTSGLSTGPHLHFELLQGDKPVDPFEREDEGDDAGAVERLVDTIIHVESGGRIDAKNPLSSATGLGQFIDRTWLRMVATYRPDLGATLAQADILTLRGDSALSREMVRHLAMENAASLRSAGHAVTAGRLYLAHFLGPEGANTVLSAPADADLASLLGAGVIRANPFLDGQSAAYVADWAERKMADGGRIASTQAAKPSAPPSPAFLAYRNLVDAMLAEASSRL